MRGVEAIHTLTGATPRGDRSPAWDLSANRVALLLQHGFDYDSSMMGHDILPYQVRDGDGISFMEPMAFGDDTALV